MKGFKLRCLAAVAVLVLLAVAPAMWAEDADDPENPGTEQPIEPTDSIGSEQPTEPNDTIGTEQPTEPNDTIGPEPPTEPTDTIEPERPDSTVVKGVPCIILRERGGVVHFFPADSMLRMAVDGDSFTVSYADDSAESEDSVACVEFYLSDIAGFKYGIMPPKIVTEDVETEQDEQASTMLKDNCLMISGGKPGRVTIYNAAGQQVRSHAYVGWINISLSGLAPGVYVVDSPATKAFKFIVK